MLFDVHPDNVAEHLRRGGLVLVACVHLDEEYEEHRREVELVAADQDRLAALWVEPRRSVDFMNRFAIYGTPTYLLFEGGSEVGRLEGRADARALQQLVAGTTARLDAYSAKGEK